MPQLAGHLVFDTALGFVGIGWTPAGIARFALPATNADEARRHLLRRDGQAGPALDTDDPAMPPFVTQAVELSRRYALGEAVDFTVLPLDLEGLQPFDAAVLRAALRLGHGETTTYGGLAEAAGFPGMARETGAALGRNPVPLIVPCHRILAAGAGIGGFSAPGGAATKRRLLLHEGVALDPPAPAQASFAF